VTGLNAYQTAANVTTAIALTSVLGVQRTVTVSLPTGHVDALPETASLLTSINQGKCTGAEYS
jgi:hypothetical protein